MDGNNKIEGVLNFLRRSEIYTAPCCVIEKYAGKSCEFYKD